LIEFIYKYEPTIRLSVFLGGFSLLALFEWLLPHRQLSTKKLTRWINNFALVFTSTILVRLIIPTAAIGIAYLTEANNWGLVNYFELSFWLKVIITFVLLDLTIYFQHLLFHALPILWRVHRTHHSDLDCDVTTGLRFHPIEILISILIKMAAIIFFGAPVITVILFEVILNLMSMFTHSNIYIPKRFESVLRWFITTPQMHRIHHSVKENETNSNFTFFISLWDRIFGTYLESPEKGHLKMSLGLGYLKDKKYLTYLGLIKMPLLKDIHGYAINHRDTRNADELERINAQLNNEIEQKNKQAIEITQALDAAKKANAAKSKFISNISHELRTPMHGILSYSNFGVSKVNKATREKLLDYFENIKTSGDRMLELIDNLLALSRLESENIILNKKKSCLSSVVELSIHEQSAHLKENDLHIDIKVLSEPENIFFDPKLISQAITNLLSNAIKFSPTGSTITLIISDQVADPSRSTQGKEYLYCSIIDEGIGIPDNELDSIFDSFVQSSRTETGAGGTGIGLAISKDIIETHGGKIWAKNNNNSKGSTFTFALPVTQN